MKNDVYYQNQELFCRERKLPLFAYSNCSHRYRWMTNSDKYGVNQTLGEMLVEKYGEEEAFKISASTHITSCPCCSRSWCD